MLDINSDGLADLVYAREGYTRLTFLNLGNCVGVSGCWVLSPESTLPFDIVRDLPEPYGALDLGVRFIDFDGMTFVGDQLWASNSVTGEAIRIDPSDASIIDSKFLETGGLLGLLGLSGRSCFEPDIDVISLSHDPMGGSIVVDWSPYSAPVNAVRVEVYRALDPCELVFGKPALAASLDASVMFPTSVADSTADFFSSPTTVHSRSNNSGRPLRVAALIGMMSPPISSRSRRIASSPSPRSVLLATITSIFPASFSLNLVSSLRTARYASAGVGPPS